MDAQRLSVHVPMPHACAATLGGVTFLTAHASAQHKRIVFGVCGFGTLNRLKVHLFISGCFFFFFLI